MPLASCQVNCWPKLPVWYVCLSMRKGVRVEVGRNGGSDVLPSTRLIRNRRHFSSVSLHQRKLEDMLLPPRVPFLLFCPRDCLQVIADLFHYHTWRCPLLICIPILWLTPGPKSAPRARVWMILQGSGQEIGLWDSCRRRRLRHFLFQSESFCSGNVCLENFK